MMTSRQISNFLNLSFILGLLAFAAAPSSAKAEPTAEAITAFNAYVKAVESRLAQQHQS